MSTLYPNTTYMTPSTPPKGAGSNESIKPTLLAFHGSGSNATIHTIQLARLVRVIRPHFNIESLEAPFPSAAGPGVLPFFDGCGPFKRWLPPAERVSIETMRTGDSISDLAPEVEALVRSTVQKIRADGGKVIGLVGFSQGTKIVAGLLKGTEIRRALVKAGKLDKQDVDRSSWLDFDFALSVCASYPPPLMPPAVLALLDKAGLEEGERKKLLDAKIGLPAFHVQGKQDEWNWAGQGLIDRYYEAAEGKSEVVLWDMGHHYPVAPEESARIGDWMMDVLRKIEGGVQVER